MEKPAKKPIAKPILKPMEQNESKDFSAISPSPASTVGSIGGASGEKASPANGPGSKHSTDWRAPMAEGVLVVESDPIRTFLKWLQHAKDTPVAEPTAMTLATADRDGRPHARIVLFKGTSADASGWDGVEFYTNFTSPKSNQLIENPFAALVFHWPQLRRQIRFEGRVEQLAPAESDVYFQSRARGSRIGAWSSPQSQKIGDRVELEELVHETEVRFGEGPIPCPPFWGGMETRSGVDRVLGGAAVPPARAKIVRTPR